MARTPKVDGFAQIEQPELDTMAVARMAARGENEGPVGIPDEEGAPPDEPKPQRQPMQKPAHKPMEDIVNEFLAAVEAHPDAQMLSSTIGETADEAQAQIFKDSPPRSVRVDMIRLVRRETASVGDAPTANGGFKFADMCKQMWKKPEAAMA